MKIYDFIASAHHAFFFRTICFLFCCLLIYSRVGLSDDTAKKTRFEMRGRFYDCGTPGVWLNIKFNWHKKPSGREQIFLRTAGTQNGTVITFFGKKVRVVSVKNGVVEKSRFVRQVINVRTPLLIKLRKNALFLYAGMDRVLECKRNSRQKDQWGINAAAAAGIRNIRISRKREQVIFTDDFMRRDVSGNKQWDMETDIFSISNPRTANKKINPFLLHSSGSQSGYCLSGAEKWDEYRIGVSLRFLDNQSRAGIIFSFQDKNNYYLAQWGTALRLIKVMNGKRRVLARKTLPFHAGQWYRLEATADNRSIQLFVDSVCMLTTRQGTLGGKVGIYHGRGAVEFDDFTVCETSSDVGFRKGIDSVGTFFRNDKYMKKWSDVVFADNGRPCYDEVFLNQPVNWIFQQGQWNSRPRWICDRKFSFLGAACQEKAMITWKQKIRGDFTVDIFAATPMEKRRSPFYDFPLNIQCRVHGSASDMRSGYTFVFGRFDLPSCILKNGRILESSSAWMKQDFRNGKTPQYHRLHQEWVHLRCSRENGLLKLVVDDTVLVRVKDDQPLNSGPVSIFTSESGLALARVRIQAEKFTDRISPLSPVYTKQIPVQDFKIGLTGMDNLRKHVAPESVPEVFSGTMNNEKTSWQTDFEKGAPAWMEMQGAEGGRLTIEHENNERFLRIINTFFGGMNGVFLFKGTLERNNDTTLEFQYRMKPGVHLNLVLVDEKFMCREITLTDPGQHIFPSVGVCEGGNADNTWRRARIRLGDYDLSGLDDVYAIFLGDPEFCSSYTGLYYDLDDIKITRARKIQLASEGPKQADKIKKDNVLDIERFESRFLNPESWRGGSFIPVHTNGESCLFLFPRYGAGRSQWNNSVDIRSEKTDLRQHSHLFIKCQALERDLRLRCYAIRNEEKISLYRQTIPCDNTWHTVEWDLLSAFNQQKQDTNRVVSHIILDAGKNKYLLDDMKIYSAAGKQKPE